MEIVEIMLIALSLAMDAFAVSVANAITTWKNLKIHNALKMATFFGSFQTIMPMIGWAIGISIKDFISGFDHWVAFGLLGIIGCKMIYDAIKRETSQKENTMLNIYVLLILAVATSIDALAAGVSFAFLKVASITIPVILIGVVTFLLSFIGASAGSKLGSVLGKKIEILGGIILIGIGLKILIEHSI